MSRLGRAALWSAAIAAVLSFAAIWIVVLRHSIPSPLAAEDVSALADYAAFWAAGETAHRGAAAAAWDWPAMRALIEATTGRSFVDAMPWHYPPPMQLLLHPLALLDPAAGRVAWPLLQLALLGVVAWRILPHPLAVAFALANPPVLISTFAGQSGALFAAIVGAVLIRFDRRPAGAGAALGLLALKPHVALGLPLLALVEGRARMIVAASAAALLLAAASLALYGAAPWRAFFASLGDTGAAVTGAAPTAARFDLYITPFGQLRHLGLPLWAAWAAQAFVALAALRFAIGAWRDPGFPPGRRLAIAACLTVALTPRLFAYDLAVMAVGCLFLLRGDRGGAEDRIGESAGDESNAGNDWMHQADARAVCGLYIASMLALIGVQAGVAAGALAFTAYLCLQPSKSPER